MSVSKAGRPRLQICVQHVSKVSVRIVIGEGHLMDSLEGVSSNEVHAVLSPTFDAAAVI